MSARKHRRLRYSLRTLLILVTLGGPATYYGFPILSTWIERFLSTRQSIQLHGRATGTKSVTKSYYAPERKDDSP